MNERRSRAEDFPFCIGALEGCSPFCPPSLCSPPPPPPRLSLLESLWICTGADPCITCGSGGVGINMLEKQQPDPDSSPSPLIKL